MIHENRILRLKQHTWLPAVPRGTRSACGRGNAPPQATPRHGPASVPTFQLPSGLRLRHFTGAELDFLYREVYEDRVYLQHGVSIRPGDTVVDVGANTGLFTLLAAELVGPGGRVVALEPLPATFQLLEANVAAHAAWCAEQGRQVCAPVLLNCGAGAEGQDSATFTSYSDSASGWSSMYPDDAEVWDNMQRYMEHLMRAGGGGRRAERESEAEGPDWRGPSGAGEVTGQRTFREPVLARLGRALGRVAPLRPLLRAAGSLAVWRMLAGRRTQRCRLAPLGRVMREQRLERVDLLKVDVERAELDVLGGLGPAEWPRVRQVAAEVHDRGGRGLAEVTRLLAGAGFRRVVVSQEAALAGSGLHMVHAVREEQ